MRGEAQDGLDAGGYRVRLPAFEGPLDVLLELIERRELDITRISLAMVADQFLEHLAALDHLEPGQLADFLVVASKLLLIKSRALLPGPPAEEEAPEEEEDVGEELARQLREYKRFKEAALALRRREEEGLQSYARVAPPPKIQRPLERGELSVADLSGAFQRLLAELERSRPAPLTLKPVAISLDDRIAEVERRVAERGSATFRGLFEGAVSRLEVIVTFLALLELIKRLKVRATQEEMFGEILITPRAQPEEPGAGEET